MDRKKQIGQSDFRDQFFHIFNSIYLVLAIVIIMVPLLNVVSQSISDPSAVLNGKVSIFPVGFSLRTYGFVFRERSIGTGYLNSIIYTITGTIISVVVTIMAAYPLSRKDLAGRGFLTFLFTFTMLFSGGMIPIFLLIKDLKLLNTMWALVLPNALSVYNMIIARTFFLNTIPVELYEAADLDGADDKTTLLKIVIPLSKSIIAVQALFYAVSLWNIYFDALLYLNSSNLYPLQMVLRSIMTNAQVQSKMVEATGVAQNMEMVALTEALKYATIVCSSVPMLVIYPFIQKHFTKGIMIGTLKG